MKTKKIVRVVFFVIVALALLAALLGFFNPKPMTVQAAGLIDWQGNGGENLPCDNGGHWVLAPSFGIESATLIVNGVNYPMTQNGNGSWSADSSGPLVSGLVASVSFTGPGDERNHLQLSHCIGTETPPTSTPPTETPPTKTPPTVTPPTETPPTETPTSTPTDPTPTVTPTPTTPVPFDPPVVTGTPDLLPVTGADHSNFNGKLPFFGATVLGAGMLFAGLKRKK